MITIRRWGKDWFNGFTSEYMIETTSALTTTQTTSSTSTDASEWLNQDLKLYKTSQNDEGEDGAPI